MPGVFLGAPSGVVLPPEDLTPWTHNLHTWTDYEGTEWDLCRGLSGLLLLAGMRGTGMPPITRHTSVAAGLHGSRWRGMDVVERDVFWPLKVFENGGSQEWIDHDGRFWRTLHPERTGIWTVTQPNGVSRSLTCRFDTDNGKAWDIAPERIGWTHYGISLVAEDPFWKGEPILRTWGPAEEQPYYGGTGGGGMGPPYYISSGSSAATAEIANPGDVEAWPTWTVYGPATSATVGVGSETVSIPIALDAGEWVRLETSPYAGDVSQRAIDNTGADRTLELGSARFAWVEPGASVALNVAIVGTGLVEGRLQPSYLRATG
jgi:hypothetical protein